MLVAELCCLTGSSDVSRIMPELLLVLSLVQKGKCGQLLCCKPIMGASRNQLWFYVVHVIRLYSWESGQWMKGISSPSGFKWFVQNRGATGHCRTYGAAEVATQYSVGTDWWISWSLNFFLKFCVSACWTWKRQCVKQSRNAHSRRELVD